MRRPLERLKDILKAIDRIDSYKPANRESFLVQQTAQDAILMQITTIGEAVGELPDDWCAAFPEIAWREIVGMRNHLVHEYFGVDLDAVWSVVESDLPPLRETVTRMLTRYSEPTR